jgi:general secretion pathway protein G
MDYCPFVKRRGVKIRGRPRKSVLCGWRGCLRAGRVDAFTFIELLLMVAIIGIMCGIALPIYSDFTYQAQVATTKAMIREIEAGINIYKYRHDNNLPASLSEAMISVPRDPWGHPYQYLPSTDSRWGTQQRKDRHMVPLNNDFDLYSIGRDGYGPPSPQSLREFYSLDDVVRAGNGSFVGLGGEY